MQYDGANQEGYRRDMYIVAEEAPADPERFDLETALIVEELAIDYQTTQEVVSADLRVAMRGEL